MKTYILKSGDDKYYIKDTKLLKDENELKFVSSQIAFLKALAKKPVSSDIVAKTLKISKKKAEDYAARLNKLELIKISGKKEKQIYSLDSGAVSLELNDSESKFNIREKRIKDSGTSRFYSNFIRDGKFDGYICVGSTDPHGEYRAVSKDTHHAMYLTMFLGQFIDLPVKTPVVLDTDVISKNLFKNNLIVIGGPVTNLITRDINSYLPVKFIKEEGWGLKFRDGLHTRDYEGVIEKMKNPFDKTKEIILLAGVRNIGTFSSILAATKFSNLSFASYNGEKPWSMLVRGYDIDGDGEVDSVETVR